MHARMGHFDAGLTHNSIVETNQIDVDGAVGIASVGVAVGSIGNRPLHGVQPLHQLGRAERGMDVHSHVKKAM